MTRAFQPNAFQNNAFQVSSGTTTRYAHAQAQADIKQTYNAFAQSQAGIKATSNGFAQAQALTGQHYWGFAQAQCDIKAISNGFAQAQGTIKATTWGFAQSQADIKQTYNGHAQAQCSVATRYWAFSQAQCSIKAVSYGWSQAQCQTKQTYQGYAQAQCQTKQTYQGYAQAQCTIAIRTSQFAQAQAEIEAGCEDTTLVLDTFTRTATGDLGTPDIGDAYNITDPGDESNTSIGSGILTLSGSNDYDWVYGEQSAVETHNGTIQIDFKPTGSAWSTYIELVTRISRGVARLDTFVFDPDGNGVDLGLFATTGADTFNDDAFIPAFDDTKWYTLKAMSDADRFKVKLWMRDDPEPVGWDVDIECVDESGTGAFFYGDIGEDHNSQQYDNFEIIEFCATATTTNAFAQAQAKIKGTGRGYAQARCHVKATANKHAQAQCLVDRGDRFAQAQCDVVRSDQFSWAQAKTTIAAKRSQPAQAQGKIKAFAVKAYAQAVAQIKSFGVQGYAQAQALINSNHKQGYAQAQCRVSVTQGYAQAQCLVQNRFKFAQVQAQIRRIWVRTGQAQAKINSATQGYSQAQAWILNNIKHAQARCVVRRINNQGYAQAQCKVRRSVGIGQAQCFIEGGKFLVRYNQYLLPGYAQTESISSPMKIEERKAVYLDSSLSEYIGLENKMVSLTMKVFEGDTYQALKTEVQRAGTILRSARDWAKLYIQRSDRYYLAMTSKVNMEQEARGKAIEYNVEWETMPWLISDQEYQASGTGLITVSRTLDDGGWTPTSVTVTGTNITISGYTAIIPYTGFISISGAVSNFVITTQPFTATNNSAMMNPDYELYIGPETNYILVSGASSCVITYNNRWYL